MKVSQKVLSELRTMQLALAGKYDDADIVVKAFMNIMDDDVDETLAIENYLRLLIEYNEQKEEYENCALIQQMLRKEF
ncbi:MAG: hypothetical protein JWN56_229 [Sphingobacteriales bacterium]|nr:hypothetical protein [Sphingobacteriales bacterium]